MKEYASNKTSLLQEAKGRVKQEGKKISGDRIRSKQTIKSKTPSKKTPSTPLSKSTKQLILLVVGVLVLGFILYHIPYGKIGRAISEKTHHLGKTVHQQVVSKNTQESATATTEDSKNTDNSSNATDQKSKEKAAEAKPVPPKPTLDFYKVLPKRKVVVTWS